MVVPSAGMTAISAATNSGSNWRAALALQLAEDPVIRAGGLVRSAGAHHIEGVDDDDDARAERYVRRRGARRGSRRR